MDNFIQNILARLVYAIIPSVLWTILFYLIVKGLHKIKGKDVPDQFNDMFTYINIANYILLFLFMVFFIKENMTLF